MDVRLLSYPSGCSERLEQSAPPQARSKRPSPIPAPRVSVSTGDGWLLRHYPARLVSPLLIASSWGLPHLLPLRHGKCGEHRHSTMVDGCQLLSSRRYRMRVILRALPSSISGRTARRVSGSVARVNGGKARQSSRSAAAKCVSGKPPIPPATVPRLRVQQAQLGQLPRWPFTRTALTTTNRGTWASPAGRRAAGGGRRPCTPARGSAPVPLRSRWKDQPQAEALRPEALPEAGWWFTVRI